MEHSRERGYEDTPSYQTHQRLDTIVSLKNGPIWELSVGSVNVAKQAFLTLASADVTGGSPLLSTIVTHHKIFCHRFSTQLVNTSVTARLSNVN